MTTAAVVLAALLAVAAVIWVARPLVAPGGGDVAAEDEAARGRLRLLEARDRALAALKELEFDHRTGKISDADYRELVPHLRQEAAEALAALDAAARERTEPAREDGLSSPTAGERQEQHR
jgi:hypothetical protein